uniref:Phospholipase/carboxylesterase/thioesterase domain-containing protein n=1 Tax=uncultured organism TaxID=155900 RepID=G3CRE6_9ZZZZ|nr:hypothetical protein [uncultured organism]
MTTSNLLPVIELSVGHDPKASVIWMHGLGADGNDFVPVVKELGLPEHLAVRFIFPHAPLRPVTINTGYMMRAWYDILGLDSIERKVDEAGIRTSQRAIEALIAKEEARGIAPEKLVLAGFSQGGAIALQTGLRYPKRLAGIVGLSTYLALAESLPSEAHPANRGIPIFLGHGKQDNVIPFTAGANSKERLTELGYRVQWHEYPMAHTVSMEEITDIGRWLAARIADDGSQ